MKAQLSRKEFIALSSRAALAAPILCFGCKTTAPGTIPQWIEVAATVAQTAASVGVAVDLQSNPAHRVAFQLAEAALTAMIDRQGWNASDFAQILSGLPLLQGPNGVLVATAIASVFDLATGTWLDVESAPAVKRVVSAVRDGIRAGLLSGTGSKSLKSVKVIKIPVNAPRIRI